MQIVNCSIEECAASRFIGRRYTPADSINGSYSHKWGEWWAQNLFAPLEKLPHLPIVGDSTMAAMRVVDGQLEYWIGFFCPPDTAVPEGYEAVDVAPRRYAVCWTKGPESDLYGLENHHRCLEKLTQNGWQRAEDDWCIERYNCPRFTTPDENGEVILDYCIAIH